MSTFVTELNKSSKTSGPYDVEYFVHLALQDLAEGKGDIVDSPEIRLPQINFPLSLINPEWKEQDRFELSLHESNGLKLVRLYYNADLNGPNYELAVKEIDEDLWEQLHFATGREI